MFRSIRSAAMHPSLRNQIRGAAALLLAAGLALTGCSGDEANAGRNGRSGDGGRAGMTGERGATSAIPVQVAPVQRGDIAQFLLHTTTIEAEREVEVLAKVSGQAVRLAVDEGARVRKGDLLVQLDEAELKIDLLQTRAKMETDKATYDRAKKMIEKKLIAEENYDATRLAYENAKAAFEAAQLRVNYTSIVSPISGIVTSRIVELGQRVNANQPVFRVADFDPLRARIYVPEGDMQRLYEGQAARISADALPGTSFEGVVRMISPVIDPTNGTVKVTIDIPGRPKGLRPGMFASVFITTEQHKNTLLIPKRALLLESETDQVFVFDEGRARKAPIKRGFTTGDTVEVLSGLNEGDKVVTVGQEGLREGLPIRIPGTAAPALTDAGSADRDGGESGRRPGGERQGGRRQADTPASTSTPNAPVDPEMVARIEEKMKNNRRVAQAMEERAASDPEFANSPEKKYAFFEDQVSRWENFVLGRSPDAQAAWMKKVQEDPDFEKSLEKKIDFFDEMFKNMRGRRGGGRR